MAFLSTTNLLHEGIEKKFYERVALLIGNKEGDLFKYCMGADEDTLFDMASITKIMVTTMIAYQFIEQGKLCLWDSIDIYLSDVPEDKNSITIQELMTHTAGFEPFFDIPKEAKTKDKVLETIMKRPLYSHIGKEVHYSCIGYIVLGKILETIGSDSLDHLAKQYVFEPLELSNSSYHPKSDNIAPTEYHEGYKKHLKGIVHDENARFMGTSGNAGLFSSLKDVSKFGRMLACKGLYNGKVYISPAMFEKGIWNYTEGMKESRGLGFSLYTNDRHPAGDLFHYGSFGHTGFTGTSLFIDKISGLYVVLLTNKVFYGREDTGFVRFKRQLHNSIVSEYERQ